MAPLRKWYFATNIEGLLHAFDMIQAAVTSAARNTSLLAHCLLDDDGANDMTRERVRWLQSQGVCVIRHRSLLLAELLPIFGEQMRLYSGHWLRCDIPLIEMEDEYVLYTDIDTVFLQNVVDFAPAPRVIACGPEHDTNDYSYFNSGVMVINVAAFRAAREELLAVLRSRLGDTAPYDDQGMLNALFKGRWDHLPAEWNWKPYWGKSDKAFILHFHGPKPSNVKLFQQGQGHIFNNDYNVLYGRNPEGYAEALNVFQSYIPNERSN